MSGCLGGYPSSHALEFGPQAMYDFLWLQKHRIENYVVEIIPEPHIPEANFCTDWLLRAAIDLNMPYVINSDAHFPRPEDYQSQDLLLCIGLGKQVNDPDRTLRLPEYQYYCSADEILQRCVDSVPAMPIEYWQRGINYTRTIADRCEIEIPRAEKVIFPGLPDNWSSSQQLWKLVSEGLIEKFKKGKIRPDQWDEYIARAQKEWAVIDRKGFSDYLLTIIDVVQHMKQKGHLVVCRGSAGGCLMLWATNTSNTDPIKYGLSFERFYDDNRPDPPDVDLDFEASARKIGVDRLYEVFGDDKCSLIANIVRLKAKQALQDAARAYGIPRSSYQPLSDALDSNDEEVDQQLEMVSDPDALEVLEKHPELKIISKMVGQFRTSSIHAAGVLVSSKPLDEIIGVLVGADKQTIAAVDKYGAADLGFLKMDFLSVDALDVIAGALRSAGLPIDTIEDMEFDDPLTLSIADNGNLSGVFQLDGGSAKRVAGQIGINSFEDVFVASALCRPGPSDWVPIFVEHKNNPAKFEQYLAKYHPIAQDIIRESYGLVIYQEQLMRFARELAGFEWPDVHKLRKQVAAKLGLDPNKGDEWRRFWSNKFVEGCQATNGVSEEEALYWWHTLETHGGYSFNKSHCVTYGVISYWTLWLKAYHAGHFYKSYLSLEGQASSPNMILMKRLIREFQNLEASPCMSTVRSRHS